jgi:tRNA1Val (adenine37-N6)-methyltransferase
MTGVSKKEVFLFKQFEVRHALSAMKVGTDGVLLGAWAQVEKDERVLDIGTGTGLIALMLAQRMYGTGRVVGVELDPTAAGEAQENFTRSPWPHALEGVVGDIRAMQFPGRFHSVVSNPPFFRTGKAAPHAARGAARHVDSLPPQQLLQAVKNSLLPEGRFSVILPPEEGRALVGEALLHGLFLNRECRVTGREDKPVERLLLEFSFQWRKLEITSLLLHTTSGEPSEEFRALTQGFYLHF